MHRKSNLIFSHLAKNERLFNKFSIFIFKCLIDIENHMNNLIKIKLT